MRYSILLVLLFLFACDFKVDCDAFAEKYRNQECIAIVEVPPNPGSVYFEIIGKNPIDGKKCKCKEENRWWATFSDNIETGDTIVKRKGELVFSVHKKDTILSFEFDCEGKKYK